MTSRQKPNAEYWRSLKVFGKILEAKQLKLPKSTYTNDGKAPNSNDFFCIARLDNQAEYEHTTQATPSADTPFWVTLQFTRRKNSRFKQSWDSET